MSKTLADMPTDLSKLTLEQLAYYARVGTDDTANDVKAELRRRDEATRNLIEAAKEVSRKLFSQTESVTGPDSWKLGDALEAFK